jgi:hypothetical protein
MRGANPVPKWSRTTSSTRHKHVAPRRAVRCASPPFVKRHSHHAGATYQSYPTRIIRHGQIRTGKYFQHIAASHAGFGQCCRHRRNTTATPLTSRPGSSPASGISLCPVYHILHDYSRHLPCAPLHSNARWNQTRLGFPGSHLTSTPRGLCLHRPQWIQPAMSTACLGGLREHALRSAAAQTHQPFSSPSECTRLVTHVRAHLVTPAWRAPGAAATAPATWPGTRRTATTCAPSASSLHSTALLNTPHQTSPPFSRPTPHRGTHPTPKHNLGKSAACASGGHLGGVSYLG